MDTLMVAYEGTDKVKVVNKNSLNRRYKHFFQQKNESLTQVCNQFNFLVNDIHRCNMNKTRRSLVYKFLDSLNNNWKHHVNVLKNSEKTATMDLSS